MSPADNQAAANLFVPDYTYNATAQRNQRATRATGSRRRPPSAPRHASARPSTARPATSAGCLASGGMEHIHTGKVRELYRIDDGRLVMVASDRISAFDYVLEPPIPDKGRILTAMSVWWFDQLGDLVPNHLISYDDPAIPAQWRGRAMVCRELAMVPVEAVARGYLAGSGLVDYAATGAVCGNPLPAGLGDGDRLPEPIFTPATKAALGEHDENVSLRRGRARRSASRPRRELRDLTLRDLRAGRARSPPSAASSWPTPSSSSAATPTGALVLGDEVLTPDSSRFWPADEWEPGQRAAQLRQAVRPRLAALAGVRAGTGRRATRRRRCPTTSSPRPARATSRPTSG